MTMSPGTPSIPRILVAGVVVLAASALFGWGYVIGRQSAPAPADRAAASPAAPVPSPRAAEVEARKAELDREMERLLEAQREAVRLRTIFEDEKARIAQQRSRLAAWRPSAAEVQAAAALQASVNALLAKAADRLSASDYEGAIGVYDEALKLDPWNAAAQTGKAGALSARAILGAVAAPPRPAPARSFRAGATVAAS